MSIARHHTEWLSLLEVSGPFLSMPVLMRAFPQGLDAADPALNRLLREVYEEWADNQSSLLPSEAIQTQWLRFVLSYVLDMEMIDPFQRPAQSGLLTGTSLPHTLRVEFQEHGEILSPDYALVAPGDAQPHLLIQQYPANQDLNGPIENHRWKDSPALRMMQLLRASQVRLGLITNGEHWMLIDAPRNETTAFVSWYAHLWIEESLTLRSFRSLLQMRRFFGVSASDTLEALLKESATSQQEVTEQLGYQVRRAVEVLIQALDRVDKEHGRTLLKDISEPDLYEAALTVMMRLVFLLSAEERKLLPLGESLYDQYYAASTLQARLREEADEHGPERLEYFYDAWSRLLALFRVVYGGVDYPDLSLPAYDGHLFDPDRYPFLEGRAPGTSWRDVEAKPLLIDNRTVLHLLEALQLLQVKVPGGPAETRRLSFRALDVEQIGHVYEGLLDHTARRAHSPVLALVGAGQDGVEVALSQLEELAQPPTDSEEKNSSGARFIAPGDLSSERRKNNETLLNYLKERTGRSSNALQKALAFTPDIVQLERLKRACDGDEDLLRRMLPFAGLLRNDSFEHPLIILPGSLYMTTGTDRRTTGTHYTPRSLTEPLVQHTLDPLVYIGPAEGWPEIQWQLRKPDEILSLKVCDMAMGSGAFLVQACRYLSLKLVEAWEIAEMRLPHGHPRITPEGQLSRGEPGETLLPVETEERLAMARRLVAERSLYGVDKNPMAVEMAKLSLWLITLDKERPFTFLDHALCCGDSLLGVNLKQFERWSMKPDAETDKKQVARQTVWVEQPLKHAIDSALTLRRKIRMLPGDTIENIEEKTRLLKEANEAMELVKLGADLLIASTLASYQKPPTPRPTDIPHMEDYTILVNHYEDARKQRWTESAQQENRAQFHAMRARVDALLGDRRPFHWPLMFPEAFVENPDEEGFAAVVSNPPFQGGQKITGALGIDYRDYLVNHLADGQRGSADLSAYFFLRASDIIRENGQSALLATNTIAQGDTREVGLDKLASQGWTIPRAVPSRKWPGAASLEVSHIWLRHGTWEGAYYLDEKPVEGITSSLTLPGTIQGNPYQLVANENKSFIGSYILGMGFTLELEGARNLISKDPKNRDVLYPYLNGEDLNSRPDQSSSRWVINFYDWPLEKAEIYTDCIKIVRENVKPERDLSPEKNIRERWWQYKRRCPNLYTTIAEMKRVLVIPRVSKYMICSWEPVGIIYSEATCVVASEADTDFAVIQCTFHGDWVRVRGSSLRNDQRYTPSDCFETFPFPTNLQDLEDIGERYHNHRQSIMLARQEGLTKTYNRFHNPKESADDIAQLRELHREMDEMVAMAYGWDDLALGHGFHETKQGVRYTISEEARREALGRLLKLNHERYAEEVALGLHDKGAKGKKGVKSVKDVKGKNEISEDGQKEKGGRNGKRKNRTIGKGDEQGPSLFDEVM